jgi:propionate CoA-transferase
MKKIGDVETAAGLIKDGDIVAVNGAGYLANPELFFASLEKRFLETGSPRSLTLMSSGGTGGRDDCTHASRLHHPGLVSRLIVGHWDSLRHFMPAVYENKIEAYNLPQGILSYNMHNAAARRPGLMSKIGLHTFLDPRQNGAGLNDVSREELIRLMEWDGEEYLFYKTVYPTVAVIRGTTADPDGNITMEKEAIYIDPLATAMAVKNNGGKVIVQVERLSANYARQTDVRVPGQFVDAIFLSPDQWQTAAEAYNPYYSGELRAPPFLLRQFIQSSMDHNFNGAFKRSECDRIIARRAAQELKKGEFINLGIGIPMLLGLEAVNMGIIDDSVTFSLENGSLGGIPVGDFAFGAVINASALYDQTAQFDFYEGHGLDFTGIGALEIDRFGNVNVTRKGKRIFGIGGFNFTTTAKRIAVCAKFQVGSGCHMENGRMVYTNGTTGRFVPDVELICLSAGVARQSGQKITYVTERGVFVLGERGLILTETGRDIDPEKDILSQLPFSVEVSPHLKTMSPECYSFLTEI